MVSDNPRCDLLDKNWGLFQRFLGPFPILLQTSFNTCVFTCYTHTHAQRFFIKDYLSHTHSENLQRTWLRSHGFRSITETALQPCARGLPIQTFWSICSHPASDASCKNLYLLLPLEAEHSCCPSSQSRFLGKPASPQSLAQIWLIRGVYSTCLCPCCKSSWERKFKLLPQSGDVSQQKERVCKGAEVVRVTKSWTQLRLNSNKTSWRQLLGIRFTALGVQLRFLPLLPSLPQITHFPPISSTLFSPQSMCYIISSKP